MKKSLGLLAAMSLIASSVAIAGVKDYQVTGPVLEVNDNMIAVEKGKNKERWEIARDSNTKTTGDVKAGERVTVHYTMTAKDIEVKAEKGAKKESASPSESPKK
jgi:hypothetical protein